MKIVFSSSLTAIPIFILIAILTSAPHAHSQTAADSTSTPGLASQATTGTGAARAADDPGFWDVPEVTLSKLLAPALLTVLIGLVIGHKASTRRQEDKLESVRSGFTDLVVRVAVLDEKANLQQESIDELTRSTGKNFADFTDRLVDIVVNAKKVEALTERLEAGLGGDTAVKKELYEVEASLKGMMKDLREDLDRYEKTNEKNNENLGTRLNELREGLATKADLHEVKDSLARVSQDFWDDLKRNVKILEERIDSLAVQLNTIEKKVATKADLHEVETSLKQMRQELSDDLASQREQLDKLLITEKEIRVELNLIEKKLHFRKRLGEA